MNNRFVTTEEFAQELIRELETDKDNYNTLVNHLKTQNECDWQSLVDFMKTQPAKEAALHLRERNAPNTIRQRPSMVLNINHDNPTTPDGYTPEVYPGYSTTNASAAYSKPLIWRSTYGQLPGVEIKDSKTLVFDKILGSGIYQFFFSGKVTPFAYSKGLSKYEAVQGMNSAVFQPVDNTQTHQAIDVILVMERTSTSDPESTKEVFCRSLAGTQFNLSDWVNKRVVTMHGSVLLKIDPSPAEQLEMRVIFQRRRSQGSYLLNNSATYPEALGFVKQTFNTPGNARPLADGSNYLRITKIAY